MCATDERVVITRNGRPVAVLLSPDDVASWDETIAVLSDPDLMDQIRRSREALEQGRTITTTVDELFAT